MTRREIPWPTVTALCCVLTLVGIALIVGWSASRSYRSPSWKDIEDADQAKFGPLLREPSAPSSDGALRALLIAEIHAADADERAVLDRLVTIVGGYSLLIGLATFGAVKLTSEQAKTQLTTVDKEVERLKVSMSSEMLELRNLKDGIRTLLFDLERAVPEGTDWNAKESYEKLSQSQVQNVLINETTIASLPIFLSWQSTENTEVMARLYRALASFYLGRFQKQRQAEDGERAHTYAQKSLEVLESPVAYRLLGSIYLAQYWILRNQDKAQTDASTTIALEKLLTEAERYLRTTEAKKKGDAGAACNLALLAVYREQVEEGLKIVQEGINNRDTYSDLDLRKYLPAMYINLACFKARQGDKAEGDGNDELAAKRRTESLVVVEEGIEYLRGKGVFAGAERMLREIDRELGPDRGDFRNLGAERIARLRDLLRTKPEQ